MKLPERGSSGLSPDTLETVAKTIKERLLTGAFGEISDIRDIRDLSLPCLDRPTQRLRPGNGRRWRLHRWLIG